ncbi:MAG: AMP-binding protein [Burkholderiaceae bacterium]
MSLLPLIHCADPEAPLAWAHGRPISRRRYLADVESLAEQLPSAGHMLNLSRDRYRFAVGLGAALLRGQDNLLPPNHTPDMLARLRALFPGCYVVGDADAANGPAPMHSVRWPALGGAVQRSAGEGEGGLRVPSVDDRAITAHVLTSGSTGEPLPYAKRWGLLWRNTRAGTLRLAQHMTRDDSTKLIGPGSLGGLRGVSLVATVPAQHMYGFESSVLVALQGDAAFETSRPFYPADICAALAAVPRPRVLVTTPLHLKTLLDSGLALPAVDLCVCATATLAPQLAARAESALHAPLMEIYGCTEAGQVATRRTTDGAIWSTFDGVVLSGDAAQTIVSGGHVPQPTPLADTLETIDATRFRLLGRANDLINVAGKRSSLGHLNFHLNSIDGVHDGAFWLPAQEHSSRVVRLLAFVVAPQLSRAQILAALRVRVDAAFLPRRIVWLDALPRDATGKLPSARLAELAQQVLHVDDAVPIEAAPQARPLLHRAEFTVPAAHRALPGHFPGHPVVPGVVLLAEVMEAALALPELAARIGPQPRIAVVKFLAPVTPGTPVAPAASEDGDARLVVQFEDAGARIRFEVHEVDPLAQRAASGELIAVAPPRARAT